MAPDQTNHLNMRQNTVNGNGQWCKWSQGGASRKLFTLFCSSGEQRLFLACSWNARPASSLMTLCSEFRHSLRFAYDDIQARQGPAASSMYEQRKWFGYFYSSCSCYCSPVKQAMYLSQTWISQPKLTASFWTSHMQTTPSPVRRDSASI